MGVQVQIAKWGNSLGLRVPRIVAESAGIGEGTRVDIEAQPDGSIVVRKAKPRYTLEELFAGMTPDRAHPALIDDAPRDAEFPDKDR